LAEAHGLRPLLALNLEPLRDQVPRHVYAELWSRLQALRRRNTELASELLNVLDHLDRVNIRAIPFKGPSLAVLAYGHLHLREFGDLDILVDEKELGRAVDCLGAMGYRPKYPMNAAARDAYLHSRIAYDFPLQRTEPEVLVELHWKSDAEFPVEGLPGLAQRGLSTTSTLAGREVPALELEEVLVLLLVHGSKHLWLSLGWLVDIVQLLGRCRPIDWGRVTSSATLLGAGTRVALGLELARIMLDTPLPDSVRSWIGQHPRARAMAQVVDRRTFDVSQLSPGPWRRLKENLCLYDSWPLRLRHVAEVVVKPGVVEWTRIPLPRALHFLYLPIRLGRLAWKHFFTGSHSSEGRASHEVFSVTSPQTIKSPGRDDANNTES
jgi:hypothetical protein